MSIVSQPRQTSKRSDQQRSCYGCQNLHISIIACSDYIMLFLLQHEACRSMILWTSRESYHHRSHMMVYMNYVLDPLSKRYTSAPAAHVRFIRSIPLCHKWILLQITASPIWMQTTTNDQRVAVLLSPVSSILLVSEKEDTRPVPFASSSPNSEICD